MFYQFRQNNSGGIFTFDQNAGISVNVIIEAHDVDAAIQRAEDIGIYFDGCEQGLDCECCGDRWHRPWKGDGRDVPSDYGEPIVNNTIKGRHQWMNGKPEGFIHYLDGRVVPLMFEQEHHSQ